MEDIKAVKQSTDEELALQAARAGSEPDFEELVHRYSPRLFQFLRQKTRTDQDAEDITQETFIKAYRNIEKYDPEWKFSTWLYTIAVRIAISYHRTNRSRETVSLPGSISFEPQEDEFQKEDSQNLWIRARSLKPDQYQALWLRYVEEMPVKEIAGVMKKTGIHVRVLLHRARSNLAKSFSVPAESDGAALELQAGREPSILKRGV